MKKIGIVSTKVAAVRCHGRHVIFLLLVSAVIIPKAYPFPLRVHASILTPTTTLTSPSTTALQSTVNGGAGAASSNNVYEKFPSTWQNGEYNNTLSSKLLFNYANPLLDIASQRQLETSDAFHVPEQHLMRRAVTKLENVYTKCKEMQNGSKKSSKKSMSETQILTMALLQSQKSTLVTTGILRLVNTIIQAFPALLIARLLKQIESGATLPYTKPLQSAVLLVSVLSLKMILENQYFHYVVKCACEVRGSVAGKGFMHEGFNKDNPNDYSRDWFAWANTLFGELILKIYNENRSLLDLKL